MEPESRGGKKGQGPLAVLTGDVVRSSILSAAGREELLEILVGLPESLPLAFPGTGSYRVDVFRGDSWQLLVPEAELGPRIGVYLRARLRAAFGEQRMDTRVGLGIGLADLSGLPDLGRADGPAFRLSGQALEGLGERSGMRLALPARVHPLFAEGFNALLGLVDVQLSRWTTKQAYAVAHALANKTQQKIADGWPGGPITQQAVGQHLDRAGFQGLDQALAYLEKALPTLLDQGVGAAL
jgi:hypothetical protein